MVDELYCTMYFAECAFDCVMLALHSSTYRTACCTTVKDKKTGLSRVYRRGLSRMTYFPQTPNTHHNQDTCLSAISLQSYTAHIHREYHSVTEPDRLVGYPSVIHFTPHIRKTYHVTESAVSGRSKTPR